MRERYSILMAAAAAVSTLSIQAQLFDISTFDDKQTGPWSNLATTTLMVPKVANNSITSDGAVTSAEYGGFTGVTVTPGINAWILNFPDDRSWDGEKDSSFTFYLAHDDTYFYVGIDAKDDVVNSDDPNNSFWKDDAIEIVVDALNNRTTDNTDSSKDAFGGHSYLNYQGRFSMWNDTDNTQTGQTWSSGVEWTYGPTGDIFGTGKAVTGGWKMEGRFKKTQFEDPKAGNKLSNGYIMGFNLAMDDDDKTGGGLNGNKTTSQDLAIQYIWANRPYYKGYTAAYLETLSAEEKAAQVWRADTENHPLTQDGGGRNSHAVTGEIIFGYDVAKKSTGKVLFVTSNAANPGNSDSGVIALLQAKGYTITVFQTPAASPDDFRAATVGQDVVLISETIGSGSVLEPVGDPVVQKFILRDTNIPIICAEAFMWDNAEWVQHPDDFSNEFSFFGNSGRTEDSQPEEIKAGLDSIFIKKPTHPIAGGVTGKLKVYNTLYSFNYGRPSADADVVASLMENGSFPTLFVYEKGDKLVDGSVVPNKRIGLHLGQTASLVANWAPEIRDITEEGKNLLFNIINYAIGAKTTPKISLSRNGADAVLTFEGGSLESSSTLNGNYTAEAGTSPLTLKNLQGTKFYRVK